MAEEDRKRDFFVRIQNGDFKAVCVFIDDKKEEIVPFNNKDGESAAAVALKSKQLGVYEDLIKRGWWLNSSEKFNEIVDNLEKILGKEIREILREFVKNPDEAHLKTLIDTFLDRNRYILFPNVEEGKLLLATEIKSRQKKRVENIIAKYSDALKSELREIHKRNFIKNPNEDHLTALITRTSIYFDGSSATTNRPKYLEIIAGAYEQLNEVPEIQAIFKVVANVKNLNIIFDFDHDSVQHADPSGNENVYGKSYAETGRVYLGAKALNQENRSEQSPEDDDVNRAEVLGVLAHELCHVAIFRIYNNNFKPYHKDDLENVEKFESALDDCRQNPYTEEIIALVLNIPKDLMHDELCVRVPHLLALYQGDNDKMKLLKGTFKKLFDYFEKKTLPDFEKEIGLMSAVWKLKSKEPQHLIDLKILIKLKTDELDLCANQILEISSNCPQMTMNWIFQETTSKSNQIKFLFLDLKHLKDEKMFEIMVDAHSSCINPIIVIDCDKETENEIELVAEEMKNNEIDKRIIFVHDHERFLIKDAITLKFSHSWRDLEGQSKNNLIKTMINFQGEKIVLEEIIDLHCDALDFVSLKKLLDNNLKIGKELELPEIGIHVPRKFRINKSEVIEASQLLNIAETSNFFLLSDDPGMGKTTELKLLTVEFKKKFKTFWVAFVDLKEYSEFYEKDENFKTEFNSAKEIANFFAKKIFKLNEFEERIFKTLFSDNRVVLLLDGFDEISPSFKKFVKMLIKSIKTLSRNILIISTRPHLKDELCKELKTEAYTFMPLTEESCLEILEKSFEKKEITEEDLKKKLHQTEEFFEKLNMNSNPVKNPLILEMVAKVFSEDQFVQDMQANTFSIYDNFVKIMTMDSMDKGHDAKQEAASCSMSDFNIMTFYQREAFKVIFENFNDIKDDDDSDDEDDDESDDEVDDESDDEVDVDSDDEDDDDSDDEDDDDDSDESDNYVENELRNKFDLCFSEVQSPPNEQITRIALIKSDGSGKFQFIHRTFAEFFVADFLFKNIFDLKVLKDRKEKNPMNPERLGAIFEILREVFLPYQNRYEVVQSFIDGAFENLIPKIKMIEKEVLMSTFDQIFTKEEMPEYFQSFFKMRLLNIITVITRCADKQDLKRLWTHKSYKYTNRNIFMSVAGNGSLYFNKKLTELAHEVFDQKYFLNFFTETSVKGENVVSVAYLNDNPEVFGFYFQLNEHFQLAIDQFPEDYRIKLRLLRFLKQPDISGFFDEMEKIQETAQGLKHLQQVLNLWKLDGTAIYFEVCRNKSNIEDYEKLWKLLRRVLGENDFKILIKKPNSDGITLLMFKAMNKNKEVLISFWKLLSKDLTDEEKNFILMEEGGDGLNLFDYATRNEDPETFLAIKDLYLETFGKDKMRIMLTRERKNGESILFNSVIYGNVAAVKALWNFIQEIFDVSNRKRILIKTNEDGETFYQTILNRKDFNELMKIFEQFIKEHLTALEKEHFKYGDKGWLQNYFTGKNENEESVVSLIFKSNRSDSSLYDQLSDEELYSIIDSSLFKFFSKGEILALRSELEKTEEVGLKHLRHFLNSWTVEGGSIYLEILRNMPTAKDFEKLWMLLQIILDENDFKILIKKPNSDGITPLMFKAMNKNKEVLISFWKLLSEVLTDEEKYFILMEENEFGDNAFDFATWNKDPETFFAIKNLYLKTLGENKMKIMLTRERKKGESILLTSVEYDDDNAATVKALWTFIQQIFDISTQKRILLKADEKGNTLHGKILNRKDFDEEMMIFEPFIEEHLTALEKEQFEYKSEQSKIIESY